MSQTNTEVRVNLHDITACGYYGSRRDNHLFFELNEVLLDLKRWANGLSLAETATFEVGDGENLHPTYLFDIRNDNGAWLVTTWNETSSFESGVASVSRNDKVGSVSVSLTDVGDENIPGFPTYFYILPEESLLVIVKLRGLWTCQREFRRHVKGFLDHFSSKVSYKPNSNGEMILQGYFNNPEDDPNIEIRPRFDTAEIRNPGKLEEIKLKFKDIRKIVRKASLNINKQEDLDLFQKLLGYVGLRKEGAVNKEVRIKYEMNGKVTLAELEAMIASWEEDHQTKWDDYGVIFKGGPNNPSWFSNSLASGRINLSLEYINEAEINLETMLTELNRMKNEILKLRS